MGGLFSKPKSNTPTPTPTPPAPDRSASQVQEAAEAQRKRFYATQGGRSDTMLTTNNGTEQPGTVARFLGQVGKV